MLHVRYEGRSYDLKEQVVGLTGKRSAAEVKAALARYFDVGLNRFDGYVVEFTPNDDVIVRPQAVYG